MTAYVVDFTKSGDELLLDLVNHDNGLAIQPEEVVLVKPPTILSNDPNFNTETTITTNNPDVDVADVQVRYNRIDIDVLFSYCELQVQELEVDFVDGVMQDNDKLYAEINRKYGTAFNATDFELVVDAQNVASLTARAESVSYLGAREVRLINSMASRIPNVNLTGYHIQPINDKYILVPNGLYPINSYFSSAHAAGNPANEFGGAWEKQPAIILSATQHYFYGLATEMGTFLADNDTIPECDHYAYVRRADDAVFNSGKAVTVDKGNGVKVIKITAEDSPLKDREFAIDPEPVGFKTYMMIRKDEGVVSSTVSPQHVWKRIG